MKRNVLFTTIVAASLAVGSGCRQLPGTDEQQGAVIGGTGGAIAGAAVSENRLLGALIGGAVGAAGGYLIGANRDRILGEDKAAAEEAVQEAQTSPATAEQARNASTADLNNDGFVTLDEVVAMDSAGMTDEQIIDRMRATDQVFELTASQRTFLRDRGVSSRVINEMPEINRETREQLLSRRSNEVISRPAR
jgi:hypothetical protein